MLQTVTRIFGVCVCVCVCCMKYLYFHGHHEKIFPKNKHYSLKSISRECFFLITYDHCSCVYFLAFYGTVKTQITV